ncbi:MAG TPA: chorismate synthase, partial [Clostridia bacterium]|nr:chorismate synthase [Clostridia bacterium]
GSGGRMAIERDRAVILSGVRKGFTTGAPITIQIENRDWANWKEDLAAEPEPPDLSEPPEPSTLPESSMSVTATTRRPAVTRPRPGHADLAGAMKYALQDMRDVLERASARETAARCAVGAVAKAFLEEFGVKVISHVLQIGEVKASRIPATVEDIFAEAEASPVRCADPVASAKMLEHIDEVRKNGDTLGGIFEVIASNVPPGLGSHVHWDKRLDGRIAWSMMALNGIKGVEIGLGFGSASRLGSSFHDEIFFGRTRADEPNTFYRRTNNAGGIEGGMSNGEPIVVRAAMKPIATLRKPLRSVDVFTKETVLAHHERSDVCAVSRASVVGEAVVAIELMSAWLCKFGGDNMYDIKRAFREYANRLERFPQLDM